MNIAAVLRERARQIGDAPAIVDRSQTVSFSDLDRIADGVAQQLSAAGIGAGDRVLVFCPMSVALYATLVGLWRIGGVAMFLDPSAGLDHIARCCRLAEPRGFVAIPSAHAFRLASSAVRQIPIKLSVDRWVPGARRLRILDSSAFAREHSPTSFGATSPVPPAPLAQSGVTEDSPALITFTSGSTGQPKAAVRSHRFLLAQHRVLAEDLHLQEGQRDLAALPIFVLANLASGVTSIIPDADLRKPGEILPARLLRQIRQTHPSRVAASPALLERLASHAALHRETLDEFEEIYTGGAPVFPRLLQQLQSVAPRATVVAVYGSTEAEPIARIAWSEVSADDLRAMESGAGLLVGVPVDAIASRIVPDRWGTPLQPYLPADFDRDAVPCDQPGEIVVAGDHVLGGYLGGIGDSETKFRVGDRVWHRTGDAGYFDSQGRLWLLGRCSAKVQDKNGLIYPFAVETAALAIPGIQRCALVHRHGKRVAVVELDGISEADARRQFASRLAWAQLDDVVVVDALPLDKRHNAKIDYPALHKMLRRGDG